MVNLVFAYSTCGHNARNIFCGNKEVINGIHQMFDVYSSHVVVISISSPATTLYRHNVVKPGFKQQNEC